MTPADVERIRRAIQAICMVRAGTLTLSEESVQRAIAVAQAAADEANIPLEDAITSWDPDPRIGTVHEPGTASQASADLDEVERARFRIIVRRSERLMRKSDRHDNALMPTLLEHAHDRAILEVNTARARALLNGSSEWSELTWRPDAGHGSKA